MPRSAGSVQVLSSVPLEPHVEVASLQVEQSEHLASGERATLIARLREEAAKIGCDAIFFAGAARRSGAATPLPTAALPATPMPATPLPAADAETALEPDVDPLLAHCIVFSPPDAAESAVQTADTRKLRLAPGAAREP